MHEKKVLEKGINLKEIKIKFKALQKQFEEDKKVEVNKLPQEGVAFSLLEFFSNQNLEEETLKDNRTEREILEDDIVSFSKLKEAEKCSSTRFAVIPFCNDMVGNTYNRPEWNSCFHLSDIKLDVIICGEFGIPLEQFKKLHEEDKVGLAVFDLEKKHFNLRTKFNLIVKETTFKFPLTIQERQHAVDRAITHVAGEQVRKMIENPKDYGYKNSKAAARNECRHWGSSGPNTIGLQGMTKGLRVETPDGRIEVLSWDFIVDKTLNLTLF